MEQTEGENYENEIKKLKNDIRHQTLINDDLKRTHYNEIDRLNFEKRDLHRQFQLDDETRWAKHEADLVEMQAKIDRLVAEHVEKTKIANSAHKIEMKRLEKVLEASVLCRQLQA